MFPERKSYYFIGDDFFKDCKKETNKVDTGKYVIASILKSNGTLSIAPTPRAHCSIEEAKVEAERLSKVFSEKEFVVLQIKGICTSNNVIWR